MRTVELAMIPGDGIGPEVMETARRLLDAVAAVHGGLRFVCREFAWGSGYYRRHGTMMPSDGLDRLRDHDAILLGAVGDPEIPDHVSLWGLLIPIRRGFDLAVNLRPARLSPGVRSPLAGFPPRAIDLVVVRENTEGEYSEIGGRFGEGFPHDMALSTSVFTRRGVERVVRYAAALAMRRRGRLTGATKSNGLRHTMPFWDEVFRSVTAEVPGLTAHLVHADALAAYLVLKPDQLDVVVASNLLGDILSDLAGAVTGSIGVLASANLNIDARYPSLFEPVHGSAPDIAGRGIANPMGMMATVALMLEHLGVPDLATLVEAALDDVCQAGVMTPDLGGTADTRTVTAAVVEALRRRAR
jgi:tartrate dehydrogenase/decarboxylase/D-malate dehydrogenase